MLLNNYLFLLPLLLNKYDYIMFRDESQQEKLVFFSFIFFGRNVSRKTFRLRMGYKIYVEIPTFGVDLLLNYSYMLCNPQEKTGKHNHTHCACVASQQGKPLQQQCM